MKIEHDAAMHRFTTKAGQGEAYIAYEQAPDGSLDLKHTIVPEDAQGRGAGEALVRAVLDHARSAGVHIVPAGADPEGDLA